MSELTPCNYCNLEVYRRVAEKQGKEVTLVREPDEVFRGAVIVLIHPPGASPNRDLHFAAWFGALTDHCVC